MIKDLLTVAESLFLVAALACCARGRAGRMERGAEFCWGFLAISQAGTAALFAMDGAWPGSALFAFLAVLSAWWWHQERRKRKRHRRGIRALGAKSRALRAKLVATMRERARPRPVLRPAPGGAR